MNNTKFTYQKSGVNISIADKFVDFISKNTKAKNKKSKFFLKDTHLNKRSII